MNITIKGIGVPVDWIIKLLIEALSKFVDEIVKGEELTRNGRKIVRTAYYMSLEWGLDAVADTDTTIDDDALAAMIATCEDTAQEGDFALPTVPEL